MWKERKLKFKVSFQGGVKFSIGGVMGYKNNEGYPDPTAGRAIRKADKPPEEVINFRRAMKLMSVICHVRILGKVTVVDDKGRRW